MNELNKLFKYCEIDDLDGLKNNIHLISNINLSENKRGWTLLSVSCFHHSRRCVEYLLGCGANIQSVSNNGTTVLMYAKTKVIINSDFTFLDYLIENGVNVYAKDVFGKNILDYCILLNEQNLIEYFKPYFK